MKRKRFTEEQIIGILRKHEAGASAADLARRHGISEATLYNWKAKFGGMDVSDAKRLRALKEEKITPDARVVANGRGDFAAIVDRPGRYWHQPLLKTGRVQPVPQEATKSPPPGAPP